MKQLLRDILNSTLFTPGGGRKLVFLPQSLRSDEDPGSRPRSSEIFSLPSDIFPSDCEIYQIPGVEDFVSRLLEKIPVDQPVRIFVFPPILHRRFLPDGLRAQFPMMDLGAIVLTSLLDAVAPGSLVWASMPETFCFTESSRPARERILKVAHPRLIVARDPSTSIFELGLHREFRLAGLLLEKGCRQDSVVRFFKFSQFDNDSQCSEAIADFMQLIQRAGGKTRFGFVLRDGIRPTAPWLYDAHHPDLAQRQADLTHLGEIQRLGDLVEVIRGIHSRADRSLNVDSSTREGVIIIDSRAITTDGTIDLGDPRYCASVPEDRQVQPGDICIRSIRGPRDRLVCAIVENGIPAATPSHNVITLRFRDSTLAQHAGFLVSYLRSSACSAFLQSQGLGLQVTPNHLLALPVPIADDPLRLAVESLGHAAAQFREWAEELETARGSLFESQSARNARINALSMARLAKQRYEAAALVSDFSQRVRTRFPHPIAFRWRTVESQHANLEGYIQVLECAEVTVTYLAVMALLLAKTVNKPVPWISQLAERISTTGRGTNMGDWLSILQDVKGGNFADNLPSTAPFIEVTRFQSNKRIEGSLRKLTDWRNDQSHGRGPKGSAVAVAFSEAFEQLKVLLESVEFLSDYPLRFVEETRRDTLRRITSYSFRELMGDHALVPIAQGETRDPELEAKSLYLTDRSGILHLLRPLFIGRECPVCHSWGTFFLDTLVKSGKQSEGKIVMKSLEHGHTCDDMDLVEAFRHWGMIQ